MQPRRIATPSHTYKIFQHNLLKNDFFKADLIRGYNQVPMAPEDIPKTVIITPFGLYEFVRMPFGLKNSAQTFQRLMDSVCRDLDGVVVYIDDILIASKSRKQHVEHLHALFHWMGIYCGSDIP